jgi:hypothetical protein
MKTRTFLAALSLGFMAACAQMSPNQVTQNAVIGKAVQNAQTPGDHYALTKYFEGAAREMQGKADEQNKLLEHYENKRYLYGREAQDLISHTAALVRKYNQTARENIKEASVHRQMAQDEGTRPGSDRKVAGSALIEAEEGSN